MMLPCRTERRRLKDLVKLFGLLLGSSDVISYNPPRVRVFRKRSSFFFKSFFSPVGIGFRFSVKYSTERAG